MKEELSWFEYRVRSHPHHTDYASVVWHGTYLEWMEDARLECLAAMGVNLADLVALGCDLQVVEQSVRYHRSIRLGMSVIVKTRIAPVEGVRIIFDYEMVSADSQELYATGKVTKVVVDLEKGKIMRQFPSVLRDALAPLEA